MEGQLKEALINKFVNPIDNKTETKTEEVYILCNGQINKDARDYIYQMISAHSMPNVRIVDGDKLIKIIMEKIITRYNNKNNKSYIFDVKDYPAFCQKVRSELLAI